MLWLLFGTALLVVVLVSALAVYWGRQEARESYRTLKRMIDDKDLDWVDMRQRCKRLLDRTEKAAARMNPEVESPEPSTIPGGESLATFGRLTPRQRSVQAEILKQRMRNGG
jgi:hypothetical protein